MAKVIKNGVPHMHVKSLLSLKGKIALVTGGAGLFGTCIVEALAEADGTVIAASRNIDACEKAASAFRDQGLDVHAMQVDQSDHESIVSLQQNIKSKFGRLDVFVNNAVARPMKRYTDGLDKWKQSMEINATGSFDILRQMADLIVHSGGGSIINISSMQGMFGPDFSLYKDTEMDSPPDYHFHKGGLIALTKYMARKLGPKNIRVTCISPGGLFSGQSEEFIKRYNAKVPLGRMAGDDDIKGLVVLLASDASAYITGENILIDGGLHA